MAYGLSGILRLFQTDSHNLQTQINCFQEVTEQVHLHDSCLHLYTVVQMKIMTAREDDDDVSWH